MFLQVLPLGMLDFFQFLPHLPDCLHPSFSIWFYELEVDSRARQALSFDL